MSGPLYAKLTSRSESSLGRGRMNTGHIKGQKGGQRERGEKAVRGETVEKVERVEKGGNEE